MRMQVGSISQEIADIARSNELTKQLFSKNNKIQNLVSPIKETAIDHNVLITPSVSRYELPQLFKYEDAKEARNAFKEMKEAVRISYNDVYPGTLPKRATLTTLNKKILDLEKWMDDHNYNI